MSRSRTTDRPPHPASRRERFAWCMYDFANSGYTTVVLTAIFNTYFVGVVAAGLNGDNAGSATLVWTIGMAIANALVLLSAPVLGAIADYSAAKKRFLLVSTSGCVLFTALLSLVGPGDVVLGITLVILATVMFSAGENFIAAFLPELVPPEQMGRLSGLGWTIGYLGGLIALGICYGYIVWAQGRGLSASDYIPVTNLIIAALFALAAAPTFIWLQERAQPHERQSLGGYIGIGFRRLGETLRHARHYRDFLRFLVVLAIYNAGIYTVIVLAAVYAQEVMGFEANETLVLILVVNITAAAGAFVFSLVQDRIGSKNAVAISLLIWILAIAVAYGATTKTPFWVAANLIGLAMGASQSAGRALVGQFSPPSRSGEFFGLWGLAIKLAAIIGPLTYGATNYLFGGDHRTAILSTLGFFVAGIVLLLSVDEQRGREASKIDHWDSE